MDGCRAALSFHRSARSRFARLRILLVDGTAFCIRKGGSSHRQDDTDGQQEDDHKRAFVYICSYRQADEYHMAGAGAKLSRHSCSLSLPKSLQDNSGKLRDDRAARKSGCRISAVCHTFQRRCARLQQGVIQVLGAASSAEQYAEKLSFRLDNNDLRIDAVRNFELPDMS
ncbi:hypothetical protein FHETE_10094 [Fusarium heterosporum]|uniref:Uncharacterized protein n=1 Tax=Fusarium heterosporum TaxID=42747 RepID=A0A8H5SQQ5_FUSHE|nr:hypothetical protein FHETE_10094 [Fusarium heterosporum]